MDPQTYECPHLTIGARVLGDSLHVGHGFVELVIPMDKAIDVLDWLQKVVAGVADSQSLRASR